MHHLLTKWRWGVLPLALAAVVVAFLAMTSYTTPKASATNPPVGGWKLMGTYTDKGPPSKGAYKLINFTPKDAGGANLKHLVVGDRVRLSGQPGVDWIVVVATDKKTDTPLLTKLANLVFLRRANAGDGCDTLADPAFAANSAYVADCGKAATGNLSGPADIMVTNAGKTSDAYHCISYTAHDGATNEVKSSAVCFDNTGVLALLSPSGGEPPTGIPVGEGPDTGAGTCPAAPCGPPPPPPYPNGSPAKGNGTYNPGTDTLVNTTCFADAGASGNIIAVLTANNAKAQIAATGKQVASVDLYLHQTIAACDTLTPANAVDLTLPIVNIYPIGNPTCPGGAGGCAVSPYRAGHSMTDWDADGCTDQDELWAAKPDPTGGKCGDDPWNPYDTKVDATGSYDVLAVTVRAWATKNPGSAGFYYSCKADIQRDPAGDGATFLGLKVRLLCYIDTPGITINGHKAANSATMFEYACPPANAKFCGDGYSGSMPPGCNPGAISPDTCAVHLPPASGPAISCPALPCDSSVWQFSNIDTKHTELTGVLDNNTNSVLIEGCFNPANRPLGLVFVQAAYDLHTGSGFVRLYANQPNEADCKAGIKTGTPGILPVFLVKQAPGNKTAPCTPLAGVGYTGCRDSDGDGCPDKRELTNTPSGANGGGLRDPENRWDFFNPEKPNTPHQQTVADILKVVGQFGKNQGNALYDSATDRTGLIGSNSWNLGPPDGQQTVADILAAVKQFGHNC